MPSSDDIIEGHAMVEKWYRNYFKKLHPTWPEDAISELMIHVQYEEKRSVYIKETGAWGGAYSTI